MRARSTRNDQWSPRKIWTSTPAVLVSRARRNAEHNTRITADDAIELDLLEQMSFDGGVTMHRYAVRDAHATKWTARLVRRRRVL